MKQLLCLLLALALCLTFIACDQGNEGEVKAPSKSSLAGRDYKEVVESLKKSGFTNVKTEPIYDLIVGWLTKDGEVEEVSIGGNANYSANAWFPADTEVVVWYHTFPVDIENNGTDDAEKVETSTPPVNSTRPSESAETVEEVLTIENCTDLSTLLSVKDPSDPFVKEFAAKYKGKTIEFDGNIAYMSNHGSYTTRYDILIYAGDYSETSTTGPNFQFVDVNISELNLVGNNIPDFIGAGDNLHIIAKVGNYSEDSELFELKPITTSIR